MTAKENRQIKDSVFTDLFFSDETAEENDRALYCALMNAAEPNAEYSIRRLRVDQQIYMNFQNDISFEVDEKLIVFGEHQSTINYNMPLRSLMLCGRAYEMICPVRDRYKRNTVKIPKPEFYTFYNGAQPMEKETVLRLSDAFLTDEDRGAPSVELYVRVININTEAHHEILDRCQILREYSEFTETIRKYQLQKAPEPYKLAIRECIDKGILAEYLKRRGSEVENMLLAEYDYQMDIEVQREEAEEIADQRRARKSIMKLHAKHWSISDIADFVEMPEDKVREVIASACEANL